VFDVIKELITEETTSLACVVMSGSSITLYSVSGSKITELAGFTVDLPNKHHQGGQSSVRFERLADEARHNYITKSLDLILRIYKTEKGYPEFLIGGAANHKNILVEKLSMIKGITILKVLDVQYDKITGLREMLSKSTEVMLLSKTSKERSSSSKFLEEIELGSGLAVYGKENITYALQNGYLSLLLVSENENTEELKDTCKNLNTELMVMTDLVSESIQIKEGFGSLVGISRYQIEFPFDQIDESEDGSFEW
jgi:peptide chain release factor subunit 1